MTEELDAAAITGTSNEAVERATGQSWAEWLAMLDADALGKDFVACELQPLIVDAMAQTAPFAVERDVELLRNEDAPVTLQGNATLLTLMLRNLIDNAVRYSPPGGIVVVGASRQSDGSVHIEVIDQGPGIPPAERARMLQRFTRIEGSQQGGAGLGLSIVARVADIHGATLQLDTGPEQQGLCVRITFPTATPS